MTSFHLPTHRPTSFHFCSGHPAHQVWIWGGKGHRFCAWGLAFSGAEGDPRTWSQIGPEQLPPNLDLNCGYEESVSWRRRPHLTKLIPRVCDKPFTAKAQFPHLYIGNNVPPSLWVNTGKCPVLYVHTYILPSFSCSLTHHVLRGQDAERNNDSCFSESIDPHCWVSEYFWSPDVGTMIVWPRGSEIPFSILSGLPL